MKIGEGHIDPDETLQDLLTQARLHVAISEDEEVLRMADDILELHSHLMAGGALPVAWKTAAA